MKTSKFFLSTLVAAAAMTATAYAEDKAYSGSDKISSDLTVAGKISVNAGATVEQSAGTVSATRLVLNDSNSKVASFYNLADGILNINSADKEGGVTVDATTTNAVLIGHWSGGESVLTVGGGALNVTSGYTVISWDSAGKLDIAGGTANLYGISLNTYRGNKANVSLSSGRLNLGAGGLTYGNGSSGKWDKTVTLSGGTLGALTDWSSDVAMNITGGVTFDTTRQVVTAGVASPDSGNVGATITLSGNLSGAGSLNVEGSGTLALSGVVDVAGGITNGGVLSLSGATISSSSAISNTVTGTLNVSGTVDIAGSITNAGTLNISDATILLSSAIANTGTVVLNNDVIFDLGGFNFTDGENAIVSGGTVTDGIIPANFQNVGVMRGGSFSVASTTSSLAVTLTQGVAETLTWGGVAGAVWNTSTDNDSAWTLSGGETSSFYFKDNVVFGADAENQKVLLEPGNTVTVGTATVSGGGYTFASTSDGTATVVGSTLTIESGASLEVGNIGNNTGKHVALDFDSISVAGTLKFNTKGENTWSSLALDSGTLHFVDGEAGKTNLTVETLSVNGNANVTAEWDKKLVVNKLSGSGGLKITGMTKVDVWSGVFTVALGDLSDYSGDVALVSGGGNGLTVSADSTQLVGKNFAVGEDTRLAVVSSASANTSVNLSSVFGAGTVLLKLKGDNGAGFNLSNFTGTIEVDNADGQGSGRLQLNTSTLNASSAIKVLAGGQLVFNGLGTNISNDITFDADSTIHANSGKNGTLSGVISGTGAITKAGAGTLTLKGDNSSYSGAITVSGGTLVVAGVGALGMGPVTNNSDATLEFATDYTYGGTVSGGGTLKVSSGILTWTGVRNGQGDVIIASGATLDVSAENARIFQETYASAATLNIQGTLKVRDYGYSENKDGESCFTSLGALKTNRDVVTIDGGELVFTYAHTSPRSTRVSANGGTVTAEADVVLTGNRYGNAFETNGGTLTFGGSGNIEISGSYGIISGSAGVEKTGTGTLTFASANSYAGNTTISAGTVIAANDNALGSGNVTIELNGDLRIKNGTNLSVKNLSGTGDIKLESTADVNSSATLTINSQADSVFAGTISALTSSSDYATLDLVKTGTGTFTLSGLNYLDGSSVTIEGGRLTTTSSVSFGYSGGANVVVKNGASLEVSGVEGGPQMKSVAFESNEAKLIVNLDGVQATGESITLNIIASTAIKFGDTTLEAEGSTYSLRSTGSEIELPEGYVSFENGDELLEKYVNQVWMYDGNTLSLTLAIPEPSLFGLLAGLGALTLVGTRRRRKRA